MIIALTNATPTFRKQTILLNTDLFVSVHRATVTREDGLIEEVTYIHCPPHGNWEVQEEPSEILAMINGEKKKKVLKNKA